jgi:hypothetical protein
MTVEQAADDLPAGEIPEIELDKVPLLDSFPFARIQRAQGVLKRKQGLMGSSKSFWGVVVNSTLFLYDSYALAQANPPGLPRARETKSKVEIQVSDTIKKRRCF